jgi:hypothetical protein
MFPIVNLSGFVALRIGGAGVSRDVVLRIRSIRGLVPTNWHGIEPDGFFVSVKRWPGADDGTLDQFDVGGRSGAATHSIRAGPSQGAAAITAVLELTYSKQSGPRTVSWASAVARKRAGASGTQTLAQDGVRGRITQRVTSGFCLHGQRHIAISGAFGARAYCFLRGQI